MNIPNSSGPMSQVHVQFSSQNSIAEQVESEQQKVTNSTDGQPLQPDTVSLSDEAKTKSSDMGNGEKEGEPLSGLSLNGSQETEGKSAVDEIDEQIEQLQEKTRELMAQIAKLKARDDEASAEQVKVLEAQLAQFNSQLMALMNQKIQLLEE